MTHLIATFFYVGHIRPAPGTWGSLAALPTAWVIFVLTGPWGLVIASLLCTVIGIWATAVETRGKDNHDPSEIVIDEVAGQWIALLPVCFAADHLNIPVTNLWPGCTAAFVLFRVFDIIKIGPVGWADRMDGPLGVMLDDVIAGILAGLSVVALATLVPWGFVSVIQDTI